MLRKTIVLWIIISFNCCCFLQAQQSKTSRENHTKSYQENNDNWKYFYDMGMEAGIYIPIDGMSGQNSGSILSLTGAYYFNDKLGIRSGISQLSGLDGSDKYWKVPLLFAFRTQSLRREWDENQDYDTFGELLWNVVVSILPTRFELNIGPSFGYMTPSPETTTYSYGNGRWTATETYGINRRFASSLDANVRMGFQFWRICITGNFGLNYLLTQNYQSRYQSLPFEDETYEPKWFGNLGIGASFRF